jgi:hypothetical protein
LIHALLNELDSIEDAETLGFRLFSAGPALIQTQFDFSHQTEADIA